MSFDFDRIIDRTGTGSVKKDAMGAYFGRSDLLPMWVADMDFRVPECVIEAIRKRTDHGIFGYPVVTDGFYDAIVTWMQKRHGWEVSSDWILFTPGIVPALTMSVMVYTEPGDRVLLQSPVYPPFFSSIKDNKRELVNNTLVEKEGRYVIDFDRLDNLLKNDVKMMFFCNPHNPVGRVWTKEEVLKVVELCRKHDVVLISDEIHSDLVFRGLRHIPAPLAGAGHENMVICMAPSKTFNLAGMASAFMVVPDTIVRNRMKGLLQNLHIHYGSIFGLTALQAAYEGGEDWLEALLMYLKENLDTVENFFGEKMPQIKPVIPEGTYLVWLDCRNMGMDDAALKEFFTGRAGVAMNPGTAFGPGGEGFYRMNVGCPRSTLLEALGRIRNAWDKR